MVSRLNLLRRMVDRTTCDPDDLFEALSDSHRRHVLAALCIADGKATLDDLAGELSARDDDSDWPDGSEDQYDRVYATLRREHVPKLEATGVVTYDPESETITLNCRPQTVASFLPGVTFRSRPWHLYHLAFSVSFLIIVALSLSKISLFATIDLTVLAVSTLLIYAIVTVYHAFDRAPIDP